MLPQKIKVKTMVVAALQGYLVSFFLFLPPLLFSQQGLSYCPRVVKVTTIIQTKAEKCGILKSYARVMKLCIQTKVAPHTPKTRPAVQLHLEMFGNLMLF